MFNLKGIQMNLCHQERLGQAIFEGEKNW